jgi:cell division septation protein DedD
LEVAGQDKAYYDSMDGLGDPAVQKASARNPIDIRRRDPVLAGGPGELPPVEEENEAPKIRYAEAEPQAPAEEDSQPIQIAVARTPVIAESLEPITGASENAVTSAPSVQRSRFSEVGTYQVQLSALRSEDAARSAWTRLQNTAPDLFAGANLDIQRADLGARGVFYRLRVGSFANRDAAKGFCADVKAAGKDCMVVAKATG